MKSKLKLFIIVMLSVFVAGTVFGFDLVKPKTIKVDKNISDWTGVPPEQENTSCVSSGEFIWKDVKGDDTGNGKYYYPANQELARGADLLEFRVTYDSKNVYFLIKTTRPGNWWTPFKLIGIHKEGQKGGLSFFPQGDSDTLDPTTGAFSELRVASELSLHYTIAILGTFKGFIWDENGKMVARKLGENSDTKGFMVDDDKWSAVEVAIPISIIGNPAGQTWKIIIGVGQEENSHLREVYGEGNEWHGGGGEGKENEDGVDPDVFDLASPSQEIQEKELASYNENGQAGDVAGFAVITESFVPVYFAK
ncbi:MAG: glucodextranase DOMON-like domain-containing protein [bacterium]|nr:glucodextranase DOMON-like domain-containing protein [bacterium]